VQLALQNTIALSAEIRGGFAVQDNLSNGIDITIVGDNDFYSQREKVREYTGASLDLTVNIISTVGFVKSSANAGLAISNHALFRDRRPFVGGTQNRAGFLGSIDHISRLCSALIFLDHPRLVVLGRQERWKAPGPQFGSVRTLSGPR
jgi:hypothetical protein